MNRKLALALVCAVLTPLLVGVDSSSAAFPGRPGPIAYPKIEIREPEVEIFEDGGIYARRAARGARPHQLTLSPVDGEPSFSANGRRLVYISSSERSRERNGIFLANIGGRRKTETRALGSGPAFFPNGRRILFAHKDESGFSHIYTARVNGTGIRQLTSGPFNDREPAISPNGRRIAFVSDRDGDGDDIFTMRANGNGIRILIDGPGQEGGPDYAPGGNRIVFSSSRGRGASNIFVARANGNAVRRLTRCVSFPGCPAYSQPAFSPHGRRVAVLTTTSRTSAVEVIRSDRRRPPLLTIDSGSIDEEGSGIVIGAPTWGPRPR